MKKTLAAFALAGSIALIGSAPAMAATYPPLPPQAAVSDGVVGPGETFIFRGQGFLAGESLTIRVTPGNPPAASGANVAGSRAVAARISVVTEAQTLKATADANGAFAVPVAINEPGTYILTATGDTSGITVGPVTVTVAASLANTGGAPLANTGGTPLANTGTDASLLLWGAAGVGALGLGAAGVIVARRNKNTASA